MTKTKEMKIKMNERARTSGDRIQVSSLDANGVHPELKLVLPFSLIFGLVK